MNALKLLPCSAQVRTGRGTTVPPAAAGSQPLPRLLSQSPEPGISPPRLRGHAPAPARTPSLAAACRGVCSGCARRLLAPPSPAFRPSRPGAPRARRPGRSSRTSDLPPLLCAAATPARESLPFRAPPGPPALQGSWARALSPPPPPGSHAATAASPPPASRLRLPRATYRSACGRRVCLCCPLRAASTCGPRQRGGALLGTWGREGRGGAGRGRAGCGFRGRGGGGPRRGQGPAAGEGSAAGAGLAGRAVSPTAGTGTRAWSCPSAHLPLDRLPRAFSRRGGWTWPSACRHGRKQDSRDEGLAHVDGGRVSRDQSRLGTLGRPSTSSIRWRPKIHVACPWAPSCFQNF